MAWRESGQGSPMLFLHGNPTSSYLWRNVIPELEGDARCMAPDLMGMGASDPLPTTGPSSYRFADHYRFLERAIDSACSGEKLTLVVHDWGSALGFHWASQHAERVIGIAYMEAIVRPLTWDEWPESSRPFFQALRSPKGDDLILQRNLFIEKVLPGSVLRNLSAEEMAVYRERYQEPGESRRPMLTWPRELPIENEPADVTSLVQEYSKFMAETRIPKLFINADPGAILVGAQREFCRLWPSQTEVTVRGVHFIQEDSPAEIGAAIRSWLRQLSKP